MRRLFFVLVIVSVFGLLSAPAAAATGDGASFRRPTVAMLPVINNSGQKRTNYMAEMVNEALYAKFSPDRYLLIDGPVLEESLRRQGIEDSRQADSASLTSALRGLGVEYSVRTEIMSVLTRQRVYFPDIFLLMKAWTANVPVSFVVTNVTTGEVVYAATFAEYAKHDNFIGFADRNNAIRLALDKVLDRFAQEQIVLE